MDVPRTARLDGVVLVADVFTKRRFEIARRVVRGDVELDGVVSPTLRWVMGRVVSEHAGTAGVFLGFEIDRVVAVLPVVAALAGGVCLGRAGVVEPACGLVALVDVTECEVVDDLLHAS